MKPGLARSAKIFFSPEALFPFFLGSVCLAMLGSAVYQMLTNWLGTSTSAALKVALGSLLILIFSVIGFRWVLARAPAPPPLLRERPPDKRRGLILLVSKAEACQKAIRYHQPKLERCWLLCSTKTFEMARTLSHEFPAVCRDEPIVINDVNNPLEFRDRVDAIYAHLPDGWQEADIIADYAGMTAHASVGIALAYLGSARPLQYTPARFNEEMRPMGSLDPIEIVIGESAIGVGVNRSHDAREQDEFANESAQDVPKRDSETAH